MKTSDVVRRLCADKHTSVTDLEKELGFSNGSLTKNNFLRSDRLYTLSLYFGVSMEYLMTGEESIAALDPAASHSPNSKESLRFIDKLHSLDESGRKKVEEYIDDLIASGKYKKVQALDA